MRIAKLLSLNLPDSSKSLLRQYPYFELNCSLAKFCQIRHSRRIRQNHRSVGTPISSSINLQQNFVTITILTEFARFVKITTSSVPLSRTQSLFGEILSNSPFSPDSSKSPLCWYPYLELNRSSAKFRHNRHSRRICQIRQIHQNCYFICTPISSSISLWRNFVKIAILAEFAGFVEITTSSVPLSQAQSFFGKILSKLSFSFKFAKFIKIANLLVPVSRAQSLFIEILSQSPFSLDSSKLPLRRYPYLELNRPFRDMLANFRNVI